MSNPTIKLIQHLILSLKAGRSVSFSIKSHEEPRVYKKISSLKNLTNIEYELNLLLEKGLSGFPILKLLENLHVKATNQLIFEMDKHSKAAPFTALVPLFLFQVPSLTLIFLYPMVSTFLKELN